MGSEGKAKKRKVKDESTEKPKKVTKKDEDVEVEAGTGSNDVEAEIPMDVEQAESAELQEEKRPFFSKDFKMTEFRTLLRGNNFVTELRHFLYLASTRPQLVAKYIQKSGKPMELVKALEAIDKTNYFHVAYICEALEMVLLEIVNNHKDLNECAVAAASYFLKSHNGVIEKLTKSPRLDHRRCALKLLAVIVCVDPQLGRLALSSLDHLATAKAIEGLLSHSNEEWQVARSVRKAYTDFVLTYLIDGNIVLVRNILDKSHHINALISGLLYDDSVSACVILNTLKKFVLETTAIPKTKKVFVFSVDCVKNLLKLYQWRGPQAFASTFDKKKQQTKVEADPEELSAVSEAVHEFLMMLLTSRKYGITFDAVKNFKRKANLIQKQIVGSIDRPWSDPKKTDLVLGILKACPELSRKTVKHYGSLLNPFKSGQNYWVPVAEFNEKLISEMRPQRLKTALDEITLTDYTHWIKDICLSSEILMHLKGKNSLKSERYATRRATICLLRTMYQQYCNYMNAIVTREKYKNNDLRRFKFDILDHIFVNFPTVENIMLSLYMSIKDQENPEVNVLEHLDITLDLLLVICQQNRTFVNKTATIIDYLQLLRPLYASSEDDEDAGTNEHIELELKAIKIILLLIPNALKPNQPLFKNVLKSFVKAFLHGNQKIQAEAGDLLHQIFRNTGLFENNAFEINLWLEALRFVDPAVVPSVCSNIFLATCRNPRIKGMKKVDVVDTSVNVKNLEFLFQRIEQGRSVQGYIEPVSMSPLLRSALSLEDDKFATLQNYVEIVAILIFHYVASPQSVRALLEAKKTVHKPVTDYLSSWLQKLKAGDLHFESFPCYQELYFALVNGEDNFAEVFKPTQESFTVSLDGKDVSLNAVLQNQNTVVIYAQLVVFVATQLTETGSFTEKQSKSCSNYLCQLMQVLNFHKTGNETSINEFSSISIEDGQKAESHLEQLLKYFSCNQIKILQNFDLSDMQCQTKRNFASFIRDIITFANSFNLPNLSEYTGNFRSKIVKEIQGNITEKNSKAIEGPLFVMEAFQLTSDECVSILESLCSANFELFENNTSFFDLFVHILDRLGDLKKSVDGEKFARQLGDLYSRLVHNTSHESHFEKLESALQKFFSISHQCIPALSREVFEVILNHGRITKPTVRLAALLLERSDAFSEVFVSELPKHLTKKELVYPLLNSAFGKGVTFEQNVLNSIYQEYKTGFMKTIEKPQKAGVIYKENVETSVYLIEKCMPVSECVDFCKKNLKLDVVETFQVKVMDAIFRKAINSIEDEQVYHTVFVQYLNLAVQMFTIVLKREVTDSLKVSTLAFLTYDWIQNYLPAEGGCDFAKILKSSHWMNFCKSSLKLGIQKTDVREDDNNFGLILKLLAYLCDLFYENDSEDPEAGQLFEMIFSHSKFLGIVLSQQVTQVKAHIFHLLVVFAKKNKSVLSDKHVPILLGAYQAKLNCCDRYVLALIQRYESAGVSLQAFRPFIWGESAITFYSLKEEGEKVHLEQQEISVNQVMSIVDRYTCEHTLENYPIWRKLNAIEQLPEVAFENPDFSHLKYGKNSMEKTIEMGLCDFDEATLRLCPKRESLFDECYDPAFLVPLMAMCYSPEVFSQPVRAVQNGLLSVVFAALSSQDKHMRLAAGCTQLRYKAHIESNKFYDKPVWLQAYDNIQSGLTNLRADWLKHKHHGVPRVPYIPALFISRTFNLIIDPTNTLYSCLAMYLRLRNSFDFLCVPEFNVLFHSPEIEHHAFRKFIIEVIRDGIKCSSDLFLLVSTSTFKALMGFYNSTMSTLEMNLLILSVLSTCVKIPASSKIMIEHVGILPWLGSVISGVEYFHFDTIEGIINILSNLWFATKANEKKFHNLKHIQCDIFRLLAKLLPIIGNRVSPSNFEKFLNVLVKTAQGQHKIVNSVDLDKLINCAEKFFGDHAWVVRNIKTNGPAGAETKEAFERSLKESSLAMDEKLALCHLRQFVVEWAK